MITGGVATVGGLVWLPLGQAVALGICYQLLVLTVRVVETTARIPYAAFDWPLPAYG